jgi:RNA polymerase sigma factor (sigma-70 family)
VDDPKARFTSLYDAHYRRVLGYALLRAEPTAAQDVVSETFLIAWRRFGDIPQAAALPWLLGVARNLLRRQRDAGRREQALVGRIALLTTAADLVEWDLAEHVVERETALAALVSLSDTDVEAMVLATWYGLTPRQAATVVGSSATAFAVRLHRARQRLTQALRTANAPTPRLPSHAVDRRVQEET